LLPLTTVPQLARWLGTSESRVRYAASKYAINPVATIGGTKLFDVTGAIAIVRCMLAIAGRRRTKHRADSQLIARLLFALQILDIYR